MGCGAVGSEVAGWVRIGRLLCCSPGEGHCVPMEVKTLRLPEQSGQWTYTEGDDEGQTEVNDVIATWFLTAVTTEAQLNN